MTPSGTTRRLAARAVARVPRAGGARAWAALAAGAGAVLALAGCSAGQVTQTSEQVAAVPGTDADAGSIALRNLVIVYDGPEGYPAGGDAPLVVRLFNNGPEAITLTGVTADKAASVQLVGSPTVEPTQTPSAPPPEATATSPAPEASPTATGSPSPETSPTGSPSPEPTAEATTPPPAPLPLSITIPPQSYVLLVPGEADGHLVLTGLAEEITPGESILVTFTFDDGVTVTVAVPLAPPQNQIPRATPVVEPEH